MKSNEELIEEFLANGGEIERVNSIPPKSKTNVGSVSKKTTNLLTLSEGEELFGEKQDRVKKEKEVDFSDINIELIPEHLRKFMIKKD